MLELERLRSQLTELRLNAAADVLESRLQAAANHEATYKWLASHRYSSIEAIAKLRPHPTPLLASDTLLHK